MHAYNIHTDFVTQSSLKIAYTVTVLGRVQIQGTYLSPCKDLLHRVAIYRNGTQMFFILQTLYATCHKSQDASQPPKPEAVFDSHNSAQFTSPTRHWLKLPLAVNTHAHKKLKHSYVRITVFNICEAIFSPTQTNCFYIRTLLRRTQLKATSQINRHPTHIWVYAHYTNKAWSHCIAYYRKFRFWSSKKPPRYYVKTTKAEVVPTLKFLVFRR